MKDTIKTVSQLIFIAIAFVFMVLLSLGFEIDFAALRTTRFWIEIIIKEAILLLFFNLIFDIDQRGRKKNSKSKHYHELATKQYRVKRLLDESRQDELEKAIEADNKMRLENEITRRLRRVNTRLDYVSLQVVDGWDVEAWVEKQKKAYCLTRWSMFKLRRLAFRIARGKIKIQKSTAGMIINNYEREKKEAEDALAIASTKVLAAYNMRKALSFFATTIIMTLVSFAFGSPDWWQSILTNGMLLLSAFISAITSSVNYTSMKTDMLFRQNEFLSRSMSIFDEYEPPSKPAIKKDNVE